MDANRPLLGAWLHPSGQWWGKYASDRPGFWTTSPLPGLPPAGVPCERWADGRWVDVPR